MQISRILAQRGIIMAEKFYMTQEEQKEKMERLKYITTVKRAEILERIAEAKSHGDLSENAEYDAARDEQAANEGEIRELDHQLKNAEIIKKVSDTSVVHIGSTVTVYDADLDEEDTYTIHGTTGADPMRNIISNESPVGEALLGSEVGAVVTVKAPEGEYQLKILRIE